MTLALSKTPAEEAFGVSLPHRRMEEWRWTDLRARIDKPYPSQEIAVADKDVARLIASSPFVKAVKYRAVFINGAYSPQHSVIPAQAGIQLYTSADLVHAHWLSMFQNFHQLLLHLCL